MPLSSLIAQEIVEIGKRLYGRGLIAASDGNLSYRMSDEQIMITPSARSKGHLTINDLVIIDRGGNRTAGDHSPSSEWRMHVHLYEKRPDIAACIHAHPPYATAFSICGLSLNEKVLPEAVLLLGDIPLTEYAAPGTAHVGHSLDPYIDGHQAFLLKNHGVTTIGKNLEQAYQRMEAVEHLARVLFLSRQLGPVDYLSSEEVERLTRLRVSVEGN